MLSYERVEGFKGASGKWATYGNEQIIETEPVTIGYGGQTARDGCADAVVTVNDFRLWRFQSL